MNVVVYLPTTGTPKACIDADLSLESLQEYVGDYIEPCAPIQLKERGIELLCNEEGLLSGLDPNENLFPFFIVGNVIAVGVEEEDFTGLNGDQIGYLLKWLKALKGL